MLFHNIKYTTFISRFENSINCIKFKAQFYNWTLIQVCRNKFDLNCGLDSERILMSSQGHIGTSAGLLKYINLSATAGIW